MGLPVGFITRELWEIVVRGLWRRGISLYGSSVGEPGEEAPLLESLKVVREGSGDGYPALWRLSWATWSELDRGLWFMVERCSGGVASLCGSSVKGTWRGSLVGLSKERSSISGFLSWTQRLLRLSLRAMVPLIWYGAQRTRQIRPRCIGAEGPRTQLTI